MPEVQMPPEYAQQRAPDGGAVRDTVSRRVSDRQRAAAQTILTSGSGVMDSATVGRKTLLGQ